MNKLDLFISYFATFVLGMYTASQFKFDVPIGLHQWLITIFLFCFFGINAYRGIKQ